MGHGSLLAGRYRLQERVRTGPDGSAWRAIDETLDRIVSVRLVRPGHRHTADVVDAARRAALVEDPRLVRVLDVGESDEGAYIVSEHLVGRTLDELLQDGPLPAETARRMVGEASEALDRASSRGLHHLRLTPASLVVAPSGAVTVTGTAVEAALAGVEQDEDPLGAERADAVGLVRLLYAGLTGRWPGPLDGPLGEAPRVTGRAVPPGDLRDDVPADLDALCTVTLGPHDDGPASPGDLAHHLAPWLPVEAPAARPAPQAVTVPSPGPAPAPWSTPEPPAEYGDGYGLEPPAPGGAAPAWSPAPAGPAPTVPPSWPDTSPADDWSLLGRPAAPAGRPAPAPSRADDEVPLGPFLPPAPLTRPPRDQARFVLALVAGLVVLGLVLAVLGLLGLSSSSSSPLVEPEPAASTGGVPTSSAAAAPGPASGGPSAGTASTGPSGSPSPTSTLPTEVASISGVEALDPQGDGNESGGTAGRAIDRDPTTTWRSDRYRSASFGGLKQGLGLYLRLTPGRVTSVHVTLPGRGGRVELRTAIGPSLDQSVVVATAQGQDGDTVLTPPQPVASGEGLLLWFTELPEQSNGEYRLVVPEITVS